MGGHSFREGSFNVVLISNNVPYLPDFQQTMTRRGTGRLARGNLWVSGRIRRLGGAAVPRHRAAFRASCRFERHEISPAEAQLEFKGGSPRGFRTPLNSFRVEIAD